MDKTIRLRESLWRRAKVAAAEQGISLKALLERALEIRVQAHERAQAEARRAEPVEFLAPVTGAAHGA